MGQLRGGGQAASGQPGGGGQEGLSPCAFFRSSRCSFWLAGFKSMPGDEALQQAAGTGAAEERNCVLTARHGMAEQRAARPHPPTQGCAAAADGHPVAPGPRHGTPAATAAGALYQCPVQRGGRGWRLFHQRAVPPGGRCQRSGAGGRSHTACAAMPWCVHQTNWAANPAHWLVRAGAGGRAAGGS